MPITVGGRKVKQVYRGGVPVWGQWTPSELFKNGEQGVWFDPSDMSTLFQDREGTVPVTSAGQPVRRIKNKTGVYADALILFRGTDNEDEDISVPTLEEDIDGNRYLHVGATTTTYGSLMAPYKILPNNSLSNPDTLSGDELHFCIASTRETEQIAAFLSRVKTPATATGTILLAAYDIGGGNNLAQAYMYGTGARQQQAGGQNAILNLALSYRKGSIGLTASNSITYNYALPTSLGDNPTGNFMYFGQVSGQAPLNDVKIYGLLMRNRLPTNGELAKLNNWMSSKSGIIVSSGVPDPDEDDGEEEE